MALRVGVSVPPELFGSSHEARQEDLRAVAEAGLDHVFIADHVSFHGGNGIDGLTFLAALSGLEPSLDLYLGVMLLALRHPMVAARQINQLALAAPGRLTVGVGVGGEDRHEFEVCGVDPRTRGRRTDACLQIVQALLAGETVQWQDQFFNLSDARIKPTPEKVRFTVGGRSDAALDRAAKFGEGWLASWCSPKRFGSGVALVEESGTELGRTPVWDHGLQIWVGVGPTHAVAREYVSEGMEKFYKIPFGAFERYTPSGTAEQLATFLEPYVAAGASVLNLTPCGPDRDTEIATIAEVKQMLVG